MKPNKRPSRVVKTTPTAPLTGKLILGFLLVQLSAGEIAWALTQSLHVVILSFAVVSMGTAALGTPNRFLADHHRSRISQIVVAGAILSIIALTAIQITPQLMVHKLRGGMETHGPVLMADFVAGHLLFLKKWAVSLFHWLTRRPPK
jgi:hypothetical protein